MNARDDPERRVLVLAPGARDAALTSQVLASANFGCTSCKDLRELGAAIVEGAAVVVAAEEAMLGSGLVEIQELLSLEPAWSDLPFVMLGPGRLSERSDDTQPGSGLKNVTFLERPVRKSTLVAAVRAGMRARLRQYEVRSLVAQLETRVRERDHFLAMLGHELRNPLGAILTATELMSIRNASAFTSERGLIERQTRHLCRLVDDLLDVSRITSGKIVLEREVVSLAELLERCVESVRPSARAHRLKLELTTPDEGEIAVEGDAVRLEQVVNNLLTNAIKYTAGGGCVSVSLAAENGKAVIRVADSGVGIGPETLPHVFDLFVQDRGTMDRAQGGMGIGLTLVRSLVELHGGQVSVSSAGRGQGSEFSFRIPIARRRAAQGTSGDTATPPTGPARHIVLVEDNEDIRAPLEALLTDSGHRVESVADGGAGIGRILATGPDAALVDIGLPGVDGYEVARRVRAELGGAVLLIAISGYGQPEDRERALAAGFDAHLTKPIRLATLEDLLSRMIRAPLAP